MHYAHTGVHGLVVHVHIHDEATVAHANCMMQSMHQCMMQPMYIYATAQPSLQPSLRKPTRNAPNHTKCTCQGSTGPSLDSDQCSCATTAQHTGLVCMFWPPTSACSIGCKVPATLQPVIRGLVTGGTTTKVGWKPLEDSLHHGRWCHLDGVVMHGAAPCASCSARHTAQMYPGIVQAAAQVWFTHVRVIVQTSVSAQWCQNIPSCICLTRCWANKHTPVAPPQPNPGACSLD
jgi:hypothetical protein